MDRISIVVCTYNRSRLLQGCLESLENQTLDPACFEVIIVDNNSTDATEQVGEHFVRKNSNFYYYFETDQGLSHARNRGWSEASGAYVGYIDDDAKASPQWVETALRIAGAERPDVLGGPYYAFYDGPRPFWFLDRYESDSKGDTARTLQESEYLNGSNIFFKRELLSALGGFNPDFGMSGNKTAYGEETTLMIAARDRFPGLKVYYDPELYVFHLAAPDKMKLSRVAQRRFVAGRWSFRVFRTEGSTLRKSRPVAFMKVCFWAVYFGADLIRALFRDRSVHPFLQNYWYEHSFRILERIGGAWENLAGSPKIG
jgi:glucosyl-dolichyl phosphate glucuronosyltransferase